MKQLLPHVRLHCFDAFGLRVSSAPTQILLLHMFALPPASSANTDVLARMLIVTIDQCLSERSSEFVPEFSALSLLIENQKRVGADLQQCCSSRNHVYKCSTTLVCSQQHILLDWQ